VLEGVFHFPLLADASISDFGMWIGDKLVEADVVEKQRAREIYETILREKRDSGLLEWAGRNIFKARVYPIPARSEKRIKISCTQVLPLKGNKYCYSYALQRSDGTERANTSALEMSTYESEGHAMPVEIRQKQNRWSDAIADWERFAQIRALEPTGLLKLAEAQIHKKSWAKAGKSLRKLRNQRWSALPGSC